MTRTLFAALVCGLFVSGCKDAEAQKRIDALEQRIAQLEEAGPGKGAPGKGAAPGAPEASGPEEQAAAELLKEASKAAEEMRYDDAKAKLTELKEKYPQTRAARAAARLDSELAVIGKPQSEMQVEKWYSGTANIGEGKAQLLVFWEVWCPHCKREVPKLSETYTKYKGQGLSVVGLTKQTRGITDDQVTAFIKENNVAYPIAKEQGEAMSEHYGVRGIPAAAVVKDGKIVWRGHPARVTDEMIQGWLN